MVASASTDIAHEKESSSCKKIMMPPCNSAHSRMNIPPPPPKPPVCALTLEQLIPNCPPQAPAGDFHEVCSNSTSGFRQVTDSPISVSMPQPLAPPGLKQAQILRLYEALSEPTFGSPELPTVGSAARYCGNCKPC